MLKIYKDNSDDLGFVIGCLFSQAINLCEFRLWVDSVIEKLPADLIPNYMFDLAGFDGHLFEISKIIGFVSSSKLSNDEKVSLSAIAYLRGADVYDPPVTKEEALKALEKNPNILERFKSTFPFIKLN